MAGVKSKHVVNPSSTKWVGNQPQCYLILDHHPTLIQHA